MNSLDRLKDIRAYNLFLYGGMREEDFCRYRPESSNRVEPRKANLATRISVNFETGEFSINEVRPVESFSHFAA